MEVSDSKEPSSKPHGPHETVLFDDLYSLHDRAPRVEAGR
jgi:hypothetical protein